MGIRNGKVSSINYAAGTAKVVYEDRGGSVTREIPFLNAGEYDMPDIGATVAVAHYDNAPENGVILGRPYTKKSPPAEGGKGIYRKELPGGGYMRSSAEGTRISAKDITFEAKGDLPMSCSYGGTSLREILERLENIEARLAAGGH